LINQPNEAVSPIVEQTVVDAQTRLNSRELRQLTRCHVSLLLQINSTQNRTWSLKRGCCTCSAPSAGTIAMEQCV